VENSVRKVFGEKQKSVWDLWHDVIKRLFKIVKEDCLGLFTYAIWNTPKQER
jgi:hypothetical protein